MSGKASRFLRRRRLRACRGPVLVFALVFPSIFTWIYFVAVDGAAAQVAYAAGKAVQFALPAAWMLAVVGARPRIGRPGVRDLRAALASGAPIVAAIGGLVVLGLLEHPLLAGLPAAVRAKMDGLGIDTPLRFAAMGVFYSLLHSFLEEYYWRWFVFDQLRRRIGEGRAILISSVGFAGHHAVLLGEYLGGYGALTAVAALATALGGAIWAWQYRRLRALHAPWLSHLLVDAALMTVGFVIWSRG